MPSFASTEEVRPPDAEVEQQDEATTYVHVGASEAVEEVEEATAPSRDGASAYLEGVDGASTPERDGHGAAAKATGRELGDAENEVKAGNGNAGRRLVVASGFDKACVELVEASDREALEAMFMMFGTKETLQTFWLMYHRPHIRG